MHCNIEGHDVTLLFVIVLTGRREMLPFGWRQPITREADAETYDHWGENAQAQISSRSLGTFEHYKSMGIVLGVITLIGYCFLRAFPDW